MYSNRFRMFWPRMPYRPRRNYQGFILFLALLMAFLGLSVWMEQSIRPNLIAMAEYKVHAMLVSAINDAVYERITAEPFGYEDVVHLEYTAAGDIQAMQANMARVNQLKASITHDIQEAIACADSEEVYIPLGNLLGWQMLSGKGPKIPITILPVGKVEVCFASSFSETGINQSRHQILLQTECRAHILLSMLSTDLEVKTTIPIAETILIGQVPQVYLNGGGMFPFTVAAP